MTHASVFSGIGGPEIAATMLGWDNVFHCEINEFGRKILDYWYPNSKSYEDITKTDFSEWRGKVNVLTGGFPCQPFSYAGKRKGADDDRYLWPYMFRCIDQIRPDWVVAENVAGITTMVEQGEVLEMGGQASIFEEVDGLHRYQLRETFTLQRICDDLESHGYAVQPVLVPACAVGAPHRRDRVFIIGHRIDADTSFMHSDCSQSRDGCYGSGEPKPEFRGDNSKKDEGRVAADTPCGGEGTPRSSGCAEGSRGEENQQPSEWGAASQWSHRFYAILQHATYATDEGLQRRHDCDTKGHGQSSDGCTRQSCEGMGRGRNAADTSEIGAWKREQSECGERWLNFPSVSPVHRGNDGLPFNVDNLTIPFGRWRNESLKAYGNAIVPQVMYEIFRAIEITENETR